MNYTNGRGVVLEDTAVTADGNCSVLAGKVVLAQMVGEHPIVVLKSGDKYSLADMTKTLHIDDLRAGVDAILPVG